MWIGGRHYPARGVQLTWVQGQVKLRGCIIVVRFWSGRHDGCVWKREGWGGVMAIHVVLRVLPWDWLAHRVPQCRAAACIRPGTAQSGPAAL